MSHTLSQLSQTCIAEEVIAYLPGERQHIGNISVEPIVDKNKCVRLYILSDFRTTHFNQRKREHAFEIKLTSKMSRVVKSNRRPVIVQIW